MGWSNCGTDSDGRSIGYGFEAVCDHPGCEAKIDRGLGYACGGMHGNGTLPSSDFYTCERYFCGDHLWFCSPEGDDGPCLQLCADCKVLADELETQWEAEHP